MRSDWHATAAIVVQGGAVPSGGGPRSRIKSLVEQLAAPDDPRCPSKVEHRLVNILVIAVCAVVAEAEAFEDIALYGRCKLAWFRTFLDLPNDIPSLDTFRRRPGRRADAQGAARGDAARLRAHPGGGGAGRRARPVRRRGHAPLNRRRGDL
ncbi:MAG: transposase family protein [Acetobacteraceae bacterium]|nr:transposase family protein [Acetobacteraceae bacterium]